MDKDKALLMQAAIDAAMEAIERETGGDDDISLAVAAAVFANTVKSVGLTGNGAVKLIAHVVGETWRHVN